MDFHAKTTCEPGLILSWFLLVNEKRSESLSQGLEIFTLTKKDKKNDLSMC
jgi:hypothetical protein